MIKKTTFVLILLLPFAYALSAQEIDSSQVMEYSLEELISIAKEKSISALRAATVKENRYWQWRTFKSNYMPQLALTGVLPDFRKEVSDITLDDGTTDFVSIFKSNSSLKLSLSQAIGATGGTITANSDVRRVDNFSDKNTIYSGNPIFIGVWQPLFAFNPLVWDKRINPLLYEESKRNYVEDLEDVAVNTTNLFFNLLLAQISLEIAQKNMASNDTIYKMSQKNQQLGKIVENKLLQLEAQLQLLRSQQEVAQAQVDLKTSSLKLMNLRGNNRTLPYQISTAG